jgi:RHS repeat-associated protein
MKRGVALSVLFSTLFISQLFAQQPNDEWVVFGEKKFAGITGTTKTYTQTFTVPIVNAQSFNLLLVNGSANGSYRVTSATVKLNGVTVVSSSECNQQTTSLTKVVTIKSSNTLQVTVNGTTGSYLTITCSKHLFPIHPIVECVENNGNGTYTAHFGYSNDNSYPVTVPVGLLNMFLPLPINRGQITVFQPGIQQNVFTVVFNGNPLIWQVRGRIATATNNPALACSSAVDTTCPNLSVTAPVDGMITSAASVQVSGTVTDASPVTVTINGTAITVDPSGAFNGTAALAEGSNIITIIATDAAGNQTTVTRTVTRDSILPTLTVTTPADSTITNQANIVVSGTLTDASTTTLTVNGSPVTVGTGGAFTTQVVLAEGINTLTVIAKDTANNQSTVTRMVIRDTQAPILTIQTPTEGQITNQQTINVSGMVTDASSTILTVNGSLVQIGANDVFSTQVVLTEGSNTITIMATDAAGNKTTIIRTVRKDTQSPVITLTSPIDSLFANQPIVIVSGMIIDSTAVTFTINGASVPVGADGAFNSQIILVEGMNIITAMATDAAGNQSTEIRHVLVHINPPLLVITAPNDSVITDVIQITIQGTVSDQLPISLTVNGTPVSVGLDSTFSTQVILQEGINIITVIATNSAGISTTVTRTVLRDTQSPIINLTSPVDSLTTKQQTVNISGTITDSSAVILSINGNSVFVGEDGAFNVAMNLIEGMNTITIIATDAIGNTTTTISHITRDTKSPEIVINSPADGMFTNQITVTVNGTVQDSTNVSLSINGNNVPVGTDGSFSKIISIVEGTNLIEIVATDAAGNSIQLTRMIKCDMIAPVLTVTSPLDNITTTEQSIVVSGTVIDSSFVRVTINGANVNIESNGAFSTQITLVAGLNTIAIVATDTVGNSTTITRTVTQSAEVLPPDPVVVAPKLDPTIATNMFTATEFLYTGANPIQTGVTPGTIDPIQVAVLRGKVLKRDLTPLPGVKITIPNHPEFGYTLSRLDGMFDMAVNGGGAVTVDYQKNGYLPIQRQLSTTWHDYSVADSVVMIQLDTAVTRIDFSEPVQAAKGSIMTDAAGSRRAVLLFSEGTKAEMRLPDSTKQNLDVLHVRATEYTVGPTGRAAMPAVLPSKMRYTYCVELSADEAVAANAISVTFDKPVHFFVDNFLNFPIGGIVPVGWYDRQNNMWVPSKNAYVMKVIGIQDSSALIDLNGDGLADNDFLHDSLNFSVNDFKSVAENYPTGSSFWSTEANHFTIYDCNGQLNSIKKGPEGGKPKPKIPCENTGGGSIIFIQSQTLCETIPVSGTPFSLWYESDRSHDRNEVLDISLSGDSLPSGLKRIELYVQIAGRTFKESFEPSPNLTKSFFWDGIDAYGRIGSGRQRLTYQVAYIYDIKYIIAELGDIINNCWNYDQIRSWWDKFQITYIGNTPMIYDSTYVYDNTRIECTFPSPITEIYIGKWTANKNEVAGWTMNVHHTYEPENRTLRRGDGGRTSLEVMSPVVSTIAGSLEESMMSSIQAPQKGPALSISGTQNKSKHRKLSIKKSVLSANMDADIKKSIVEAQNDIGVIDSIGWVNSVTVDKDGTIYTSDDAAIYKLLKDGTQLRIAGTGEYGFNGLSGVATEVQLYYPASVKVDNDGNVYFADMLNNRICKVTPDGYLTTIAGTGEEGFSGNGGLAAAAKLKRPGGVAIGPDKNIYISDSDNNLIRGIRPDGTIYSVAGIDPLEEQSYGYYDGGDGVPSNQTMLNGPAGITVDQNGNIFFADRGNDIVRMITPSGIIMTYAGNPDSTTIGDGRPARFSALDSPCDVALGNDGALFIADQNDNLIRRVASSGIITTYAGNGEFAYNGDGQGALYTSIGVPATVAVGPDGSVYTAGSMQARLRKIAPTLPGFSNEKIYIPSEDGKELYTFDLQGRHLTTTNILTGTPIYTFNYDSLGCLSSITDLDSLITRIDRDQQKNPVEIVGPFGQRTYCAVDSTGCLASVRNEANEITSMTYSSGGLLRTFRDPKGGLHQFTYDLNGKLIKDEDPAGGYKTLTRTDYYNDNAMGFKVEVKTAEGRTTTHRAEIISENGGTRFFNTDENNCSSSVSMEPGQTRIHKSDGTMIYINYKPDPRFGLLAPLYNIETISPSGLTSMVEQTRIITEMTGTAVTGYMDSTIVNGNIYKTIYSGNKGLFKSISPEGRTSYSWINEKGRIIKDSIPGIEAVTYNYDPQGRLISISQGGRTASYAYNEKSYLAAVTDPIERLNRFEYDSVGRITTQTLPDFNQISYSYDANGNLLSLTPPGRPVHTFDYTLTDLTQKYMPPAIDGDTMATAYAYNLDKMLQRIMRPDSGTIAFTYDTTIYGYVWHYGNPGWLETLKRPTNRLSSIMFDHGDLKFDYYDSGNLRNLISPAGDTLRYTYEGSLVKSVSWIGEVNGTVSVEYDDDMRVKSQSINGSNTVNFVYDDDGLLSQSGSMSIAREQATGRISGTTLSNLPAGQVGVTTSQSYNSLGELASYEADYNGSAVFQTAYTRDSLGRITILTEVNQGHTTVKKYAYDIAGRLSQVWRNDTITSTYTYDPNGNRIAHITPTSADNGSYDAQDRILYYGKEQYVYTKNGELQKNIVGSDTTKYVYDYFGNLMSVRFPNGDNIEYLIDGQNRRIGKKVNSVIVKKWIYSGQLTPIAELDSANNVIAQFVGSLMIKGGNTYQFITDHLGSVRLVVDGITGTVIQKLDYDEYGNVTYDSNPDFQPFAFAGGLYDSQTKLVRFGARDYDAIVGRWTKKDPILFGGQVSNLYEYVLNDPLNFFDLWGLQLLTPEEGQRIVNEAKTWEGTPYVSPGNQKKIGADCSGATNQIYINAGFPYTNTGSTKLASDSHFEKVDNPQQGDVGWWNGHVLIYDASAGEGMNAWTAHHTGVEFGPGNTSWWSGKPGKKGPVTWYRYKKDEKKNNPCP